jgi:hypothetical protein
MNYTRSGQGPDEISYHWENLCRIVLGEHGIVGILNAYFDESDTHHGSPAMSVAGFLFDSSASQACEKEWAAALHDFRCDSFHMSELVHGQGQFCVLSQEERHALLKRLVGIIKQRALVGIAAIAINEEALNAIIGSSNSTKLLGRVYTACVMGCVAACGQWINENCSSDTTVTYFFEQGHRRQGEAVNFLCGAQDNPHLQQLYRLDGYGFHNRRSVRLLQTADLFAWEWHKWAKERGDDQPRPMRKSLQSLLECPHRYFWFDQNNILLQAAHLRSAGFLPQE